MDRKKQMDGWMDSKHRWMDGKIDGRLDEQEQIK